MGEWRLVSIEQIKADSPNALATGPFGSTISSKFFTEKGVPVIRGGNLSAEISNRLSEDGLVFISEDKAKEFKRSEVRKGDLIFTCWGTINQVGFIDGKGTYPFYIISNKQMKLTPHPDKADSLFLYYYFSSPQVQEQIIGNNIGSSVPGFNLGQLKTMELNLPPLPEQKAIASALSSLDDKIDLLHRQNKTLEALAETLFRQWFVEQAQEDWESGVLQNEFDFTMGQSPPGSSFNEEGIGMPMFQGNADFGFRFPTQRVYTTEPTRLAKANDTLISVRAPVGAQNMAKSECCIGRGVAAFRYKHNNDYYTYTYFRLRSLVDEITKFNDEGTVFGSIGKTDFEKIAITVPPAELVGQFEDIARPLNDKIIENCEQIWLVESMRDKLLPKLMCGEVRVEI
jgi:type I restriction enzyme S subunit